MKAKASLPLLLLSFCGCSAVPVDYAALQSAAAVRQHWSDDASQGSVHELLKMPLTADSAARIALLNSQAARAAADQLGVAQAELAGVKRLPNPTVEGALRFRKQGDPELELAAMLDVTGLFLVVAKSNAAAADVAAERLEAVGVMVDVSFDARRAFVDYQASLERMELRSQALAAFDVSAAAAERLHEAGNLTPLELSSQKAQAAEARLMLAESRAEATSAREHLNVVMGLLDEAPRWRTNAALPEPPERELSLTRLDRDAPTVSLRVAAARQRCYAAAKHAGLADVSGWLPELKAGVSAERGDDWSVGPAVELELPLFYQGQGEAGLARAHLRQAQHRYADAAVRVRGAAVATRAKLEAARSGALHARDVVLPLRAEVVKQTQLEYNGMLVGIFTLLEAKREQLAAAERYLSLRQEYWLRRLDAQQLLAGGQLRD